MPNPFKIYHHHHHVVLPAQISQTFSHHSSHHQSLLTGLLDNILFPYRAVVDKFLLVVQHLHVLEKRSIRSLLLQQCSVCLVRLIWIVLEMGVSWPYSCCFVGCCFLGLFNIARSILVQSPSCFFSIRLVSVHVVYTCSRINTKKSVLFHWISLTSIWSIDSRPYLR